MQPTCVSPPPDMAGKVIRSSNRRWLQAALFLFLIGYFLYFCWDGTAVHFSSDEMANLYVGWHPKPLKLALSQITPWTDFYRPMGSLFYVAIFSFFGFNPAPYHIALIFILLIAVFLIYRFAKVTGACELAAALTAIAACYHAGISNLYYNTSFVYDALAGCFYFAAFVYYARIRNRSGIPSGLQTAGFLALYLCALNSKEMAITLPAVLLVYEWIYQQRPPWRPKDLLQWILGPARALSLAVALNLLYIYGKTLAANSLMHLPGYKLHISRAQLIDFQVRSLGDLFMKWSYFDGHSVLAVWVAVTYLVWRRPRPVLRFCWFFIILTPLPIEFLEGRAGACLFIPYVGWAVIASVVSADIISAAADFLSREPILRPLGRTALAAILVVALVYFWADWNRNLKDTSVRPALMVNISPQTWDVIQQFRALNPRVHRGSRVVFLDDPFEGYDMEFIAELWFHDRKTEVRLNRKTPLTPDEVAHADAVFTFQQGKLIQVR